MHTVIVNTGYKANISSSVNVDLSELQPLMMPGLDDAFKSGKTFNRLFYYFNAE